jgi:serine/threonine protein kinase
VSSECRDFIRRLLDIDPAERLAVDEALMHPWIEAKYKEWSLAHPEHASDHAKLRFEIGAESSSGAGAGSAGEAVAAAEPLHRTPHPAAAASASSDSASSSSSSAAAAAVAARAADDDDSGGNRAGTSGRVNKRGRPTTVDSTADVKATDSDASKPAGAKRSTPK